MGYSGSSSSLDGTAVALTGKIMVISIIVLFVVVVFTVLLHVYAKWFWWRIEEEEEDDDNSTLPRRRVRRFVFAPGQQQLAAARKGLDPTVLKSLPVEVYEAKNFKEGLECAVCLCELEEGEKARLLPKCKHGFHLECIDMWFESHATCPLCRNPVAADVEDKFDGVGEHDLTESPNLPTNVLFWGDENEVNSRINDSASSSMDEGAAAASSSSSSMAATASNDSTLVIDIPRQVVEEQNSELKSPPCSSPMAKRLRSLRRLLSGADRKASSSSQSNCAENVDDVV